MKKLLLNFLLAVLAQLVISQTLDVPVVDNSTYTGKVMFGYQGWFAHPDDESPRAKWWHWGDLSTETGSNLNVDMYPDMREFSSNEKFATAYTFKNGSTAPVFSSGNKETVIRHMKWVRDYNTDGVFLQRFISEYGDKVVMEFRDSVTAAVKQGCKQYGRIFAIMYDGIGNHVNDIKSDWMHLIDDLNITEGNSYLHHEGKPLVALWGYTLYETATLSQLQELVSWFHTDADPKYHASIKLGVDHTWLDKTGWLETFKQVEVISPWTVGRYGSSNSQDYQNFKTSRIIPGQNWCNSNGVLFVPVIWPGFSWYNRYDGQKGQLNQIARKGGEFFWAQSYGAIDAGAQSIYIAMLDEVDESTAMFKTAENATQSPAQGSWLNLNADGNELPSDWYLRCAGKTADVIKGNITNTSVLGTPKEGIMTVRVSEENCSMAFIFPDFDNDSTLEFSIDGGASFPYSTDDTSRYYHISGLTDGTYSVYVRHNSSKVSVPMGNVYISGECSDGIGNEWEYQAEDYTSQSSTLFKCKYSGYTGSGFQELNSTGSYIEWDNINQSSGTKTLEFRYANGSSTVHCDLVVNGTTMTNLEFAGTGSWNSWKAVAYDVTLNSGNNTVRLQQTSGEGINVDKLALVIKPIANFNAEDTQINKASSIKFEDLSVNKPSSWLWTFEGGTPSTSTAPNPYITYNTPGTYEVSLIVINAAGSDTLTKPGYITVNETGLNITVDGSAHTITSYKSFGEQDFDFSFSANDKTITVDGNTWIAGAFQYTITESTVMELDFGSSDEGEVHAIALDEDLANDDKRFFQFYGTQAQNTAYQDFNNYIGIGTRHYTIPVGEFYTGTINYIVFDNDNDAGSGKSVFSNINIYGGELSGIFQAEDYTSQSGCALSTEHTGYTGSGFMDYGGAGSYIEWNNVNVGEGKATLTFTYANGSGSSRNCDLIVNGTTITNLEFTATAGWTTWAGITYDVNLEADNNTIRLSQTTDGGPNLDKMHVQTHQVTTSDNEVIASETNTYLIYPNPVDEKLIITSDHKNFTSIYIYDIQGKQVFHDNFDDMIEINTSALNWKGLYIIKLMTDNIITYEKLVVN